MSSNPLVQLATTLNVTSISSYASDGAFEAAKGSSAASGDFYYNTTTSKVKVHNGSAWVSFSNRETGETIDYTGTTAPSGWILASGLTIGDASSGATGRANADTEDLFTLLWNSFANSELAVSTGRGASAAADFAAHKTIALPDLRGRVVAGKDNMGGSTASRITSGGAPAIDGTTLGKSGGVQDVTLTAAQSGLPSHSHSYYDINTAGGGNTLAAGTGFGTGATGSTGGTAASSAHSNVQPTYILNKIIKL